MAGRKIICHWTAGTLTPNGTDKEHYHYMVDGKGNVYKGDHSIEANDNCQDGEYAAHCGGGNTCRIGVAVCGMLGFSPPTKNNKNYLLTKIQMEALYLLNARLLFSEGYVKLSDKDSYVLQTHMEFGLKHTKTTSYGKVDICYIPCNPEIQPEDVGDFIRNKSNYYLQKIILGKISKDILTVN